MKPIKFDLPLNGTRISTLDELKNNLTIELLEPFRSRKLAKWLRVRNLTEQANAVEALFTDEERKVALFKKSYNSLCGQSDDELLLAIAERADAIESLFVADEEREIELLKKLYGLFGSQPDDELLRAKIVERRQSLLCLSEIQQLKAKYSKCKFDYQQKTRQVDQFIVRNNGTAMDVITGLMWCRYSIGQQWKNGGVVGKAARITWNEAMEAVDSFNRGTYGGFSDWRLPTINELKGIVTNGSMNQIVFPNTVNDLYWPSLHCFYGEINHRYHISARLQTLFSPIGIDYCGYDSSSIKGNYNYVRLVRNE
ncbi:MAG: DUF1566 domain-containing protein [Methylococcales bacterium]|nr:DUF1566 domain-containing protein [Methylococcales bacterium]